MKTKISHLGRSSVSVILAVMMLLSTMLIGTVSTVNAATKNKFTNGETIYLDLSSFKKWQDAAKDTTMYAYFYRYDNHNQVGDKIPAAKVTNYIYSVIVPNADCGYIKFQRGSWNTTKEHDADTKGTNNCVKVTNWDNSSEWSTYSAAAPVADSVSLTASPETVKVGNSVTLTAVANNPASSNLTYAFTKTSGGNATEAQNNDKLTVTPTVAGTYKYTVTVSADGYSPVTSLEVSFTVTDSVKYYICGRFNDKWHKPSLDKDPQFVEDESNPGLFYYETGETIADLSGTISETYGDTPKYFYIYKKASNESTNYLTTSENAGHNFQNNTIDSPLALSSKTGTEQKYLVRFNNDKDTSTTPVTIWLDTRNNENNEYKLWYTTVLPHTVTVANGVSSATVDKKTATAGETVTVTATPTSGNVLDSVTVVGNDGTPIETTVSGNNATFVMPNQDVTVTNVTFREANKYTVNFSSSDDNFGSVSAKYNGTDFTSDTKVTEGDEVTFTATSKDGYALSDWTVNGVSASSTTNPYTITVQKDTTVVANFKEVTGTLSKYYLLCGTGATFKADSYTHVPLYTNEDGVFYADFDVAKDSIPKSKDYFIIFSTKKDTSGIIVDSNNVTVNAVNKNGFSLSDYNENVQNPSGGTNNVKFAKVYIDKDDVTGFTIKITGLDLGNKKITYSAEPTFDVAPADTVEITAKDGTIRAGYTDTDASKTTAVLGDTTLSIKTPDDKIITASDSYMIEEKKSCCYC